MLKEQVKRHYRHYDAGFKEMVLREVEASGDSLSRIALRHGIRVSTMCYWLQKRSESAGKCVPLHPEASPSANHSLGEADSMAGRMEEAVKGMSAEELRAEVVRLQKALRLAELRAEALDVMIDIAERQEGVRIRKKSGAKRS